MNIFRCLYKTLRGTFARQVEFTGAPRTEWVRPYHNTGNSMPYSLRIVCTFLNVPQLFATGYKTGPPPHSPYPRKLESLTICCLMLLQRQHLLYSIISRPWGRSRTLDLLRNSLMLNQLSHQCAECDIDQYPNIHSISFLFKDVLILKKWNQIAHVPLCIYLS